MAAVGAEVTGSWFLSSGLSFFILLLLVSIFLTALCSECSRRSFQLRDSEGERNPSSLIRVVKLEEVAKENPMINEIQNDEKEFNPDEGNSVPFTPWRSHLGAPQHQDVQTNGSAAAMKTGSDPDAFGESNPEVENSVELTLRRSHLRKPQNSDLNSSAPPDSAHIYNTIEGHRGDVSSQPTNREPGDEGGAADLSDRDRNSVYARVSKKVRLTATPDLSPDVQVEEEEEPSPPLPDRKTALEG